ncbi:MAG: VCBS repeat-containing protein [Bacteroidia bacterium]|nr:VCBS repeat-containing protein [Bacteroidia bacterium]
MVRLLVVGLGIIWAQVGLRVIAPPVLVAQETLRNPWTGGWNAPQFSTIDVDGDGIAELFVFDRADNRPFVFKATPQGWRWLPQVDTLFPTEKLSAWVLLRDYDGDGDKDLFTAVGSNIRVFQNLASAGAPPRWRLAYDTLTSVYYGSSTYLYCSAIDIPTITDIDNDGDTDLLVYEVLGSLIEWHRNQAQELFGRADTLIFVLQSGCWGHVFENYDYNTNQFSFVSYTCGAGQRISGEGRIYHSGGTTLAIDLNKDGLKDLIVGDDGPPYLITGFNSGSLQVAHIDPATAISPYPPIAPAYMPSFPATYYEDGTGDGLPDLIVANNSPLAGRDTWSVWLYPNTARADSPHWAMPIVGWLQRSQIDIGTAAHPTLADLNRDGYPDLLLSCEGFYTDTGQKARAYLFWGSATGFTLADTNWLNLPAYTLRNPVFTVGDIDGNGRTDLLMGTSTGALWRWEENSPGSATFSLLTQNFAGISGPAFAAPLLYDYDQDGDLDLIIGGRPGRLSLYRQEADGTFTHITDSLGQIFMNDTLSTLLGFTRPALIDLNKDGTLELLIGNLTGFLWAYLPDWNTPTAPWPKVAELPYAGGKRASPTAWMTPDSVLLLVGTVRGGVRAFTLAPGGPTANVLPAAQSKPYALSVQGSVLQFIANVPLEVEVYTLLGERLQRFSGVGEVRWAMPGPGVYVLWVRSGVGAWVEKVWVGG